MGRRALRHRKNSLRATTSRLDPLFPPPHVKTSPSMPKDRHPAGAGRRGLRVVSGTRGRSNGHHRTNALPALKKAEIVLHGRRVAYRIGGSGPLLVLIHGITSCSATWDRALPKLARGYTVLAPDLMGHGHSDKLRGD